MNNVTSIFKSKDKTKPEHDTESQVSLSEMPSDLTEAIKHIMGPQPVYWQHNCEGPKGEEFHYRKNITLEAGQICPCCFVDQDGVHHGRDGAA